MSVRRLFFDAPCHHRLAHAPMSVHGLFLNAPRRCFHCPVHAPMSVHGVFLNAPRRRHLPPPCAHSYEPCVGSFLPCAAAAFHHHVKVARPSARRPHPPPSARCPCCVHVALPCARCPCPLYATPAICMLPVPYTSPMPSAHCPCLLHASPTARRPRPLYAAAVLHCRTLP
ncbi:hypothetical protein GGX14DRAFT_568481 [Mycena pura]|uniref:Uncharacterized protein n=1 Tax=Mycena pura TaxID=153505 RepID=A0AAD6VCS3_9AGAR|nr:hypothetical protein GGX14DRAFT_568481 [Mycena pura]